MEKKRALAEERYRKNGKQKLELEKEIRMLQEAYV
jgi:hypothetical protein